MREKIQARINYSWIDPLLVENNTALKLEKEANND